MTNRRFGVVGLAVFGLALAGCGHSGSGSPSASPTQKATTTTATVSNRAASSTTVTTLAPVTTVPVAVTTAAPTPPTRPATAPGCTNDQIAVSATDNSGMGHIGAVLLFRNVSAQTCTLMGYPGVAGLDAAGHQVIQAVRTLNGYMQVLPAGAGPPLVTLAPGQSGSAFVEGTDVPTNNATSCPTYPKLLVTPANTTRSVVIDASMPGCSPVQVHPTVPGTTGSIVN